MPDQFGNPTEEELQGMGLGLPSPLSPEDLAAAGTMEPQPTPVPQPAPYTQQTVTTPNAPVFMPQQSTSTQTRSTQPTAAELGIINKQKALANKQQKNIEEFTRLGRQEAEQNIALAQGKQEAHTEYSNEIKGITDKYEADHALSEIAFKKQREKFADMKVEDFWEDKSTGTKIIAAISMAMGAYGSAMSGGKNQAFAIIQSTIEDDHRKQVARINHQRAVMDQAGKSSDRLDKQFQMANLMAENKKAAAYGQAAATAETALAKLGPARAAATGAQDIQQLRQAQLASEQKVQQGLRSVTNTSIQNSVRMIPQGSTTVKTSTGQGEAFGKTLTPGEKKADETFAKKYVDWQGSQGKPVADKNLSLLKKVRAELAAEKDQTSDDRFYGRQPDWMKSEEHLTRRDNIHQAAQGALRATLGAQFTEKEGERIMRLSYDETKSAGANIKKIDAAIEELEDGVNRMDSQSKHLQDKGTLKGWYYEAPAKDAPHGQRVEQNGVWFAWDGTKYVKE